VLTLFIGRQAGHPGLMDISFYGHPVVARKNLSPLILQCCGREEPHLAHKKLALTPLIVMGKWVNLGSP